MQCTITKCNIWPTSNTACDILRKICLLLSTFHNHFPRRSPCFAKDRKRLNKNAYIKNYFLSSSQSKNKYISLYSSSVQLEMSMDLYRKKCSDKYLECQLEARYQIQGPQAPRDVSGLKPTFEVFILCIYRILYIYIYIICDRTPPHTPEEPKTCDSSHA